MAKPTPEQLQQLQDITLPKPIEWWPPAMGWFILAALCSLLLISGVIYYYYRRNRLRRAALQALQELAAQTDTDDSTALATAVSALLRRVALQRYDRHVASLNGAAWADFLSTRGLPAEVADFVAHVPYSGGIAADSTDTAAASTQAVLQAAKQWIRRATK